jgi:NAD(P) transhydrogenase subunit alpha
MQIGVPTETAERERRVALVPEVVRKLTTKGLEVVVQRDAGAGALIPDEQYQEAGATLTDDPDVVYGADVVVKVAAPNAEETGRLKSDSVLIGFLGPLTNGEGVQAIARTGATSFALEAVPRISRAQSMDALSSQANIGGYRAALMGAQELGRFYPMLMTAAGTIRPATVLVLGAGVAGLQAIATAKRLGAVIEASDVRPAVKEQIESLGAKFLDVPYETDEERDAAQGVGGYARPMPPSWLARQAALVHERAKQADIVITTALIPGRPAPTLISAETVQAMKPGSVLVDLAAGRGPEVDGRKGGNCPLTVADQVIVHNGVTIAGHTNLASMVASDASALYARNLLDFMKLIVTKEGVLNIDLADDIVAATLLCRDGEVTRK